MSRGIMAYRRSGGTVIDQLPEQLETTMLGQDVLKRLHVWLVFRIYVVWSKHLSVVTLIEPDVPKVANNN